MRNWLKERNFNLREPSPPNLQMNTKFFCETYFEEIIKTNCNEAKVMFWQELEVNGVVWLQFVRSFNMDHGYNYRNYASLFSDDIYHVITIQNCLCQEIMIPISVDISKQFNIVRNDDLKSLKYVLYYVPESLLRVPLPNIEDEVTVELKDKVQSILLSGSLADYNHFYGTVRWVAIASINAHGENILLWYVNMLQIDEDIYLYYIKFFLGLLLSSFIRHMFPSTSFPIISLILTIISLCIALMNLELSDLSVKMNFLLHCLSKMNH